MKQSTLAQIEQRARERAWAQCVNAFIDPQMADVRKVFALAFAQGKLFGIKLQKKIQAAQSTALAR